MKIRLRHDMLSVSERSAWGTVYALRWLDTKDASAASYAADEAVLEMQRDKANYYNALSDARQDRQEAERRG